MNIPITDAKDREIDALKEELALERKYPERFCMQKTIRGQDKTIDRLSAENKRLREALVEHHRWHMDCDEPDSYAVPDGKGGWVGLNRAEEYADSSLYGKTRAALIAKEQEA